MMKTVFGKPDIKCFLTIFLCFLLTSTGWLSWSYNLNTRIPAGVADVMTMVAGYLLQAAGIGAFAAVMRFRPYMKKTAVLAALAAHMIFMVPAVISSFAAGMLIFGFLMNASCGVIAGYYLFDLAENAGEKNKAACFGAGYGLAILASWLLSLIEDIYYSEKVLVICLVLTVVVCALIFLNADKQEISGGEQAKSDRPVKRKDIIYAGILVLLFSIVNSSGFAFPSADVGKTVNVELSRLLYAAGLVIAGFVTDKHRKYGAVSALAALIFPFIMLALRGESVSAVVFWAISYFIFGFYSVYRVILFSDISGKGRLLWLSGFGLLIGRIGDATGEGMCLALANSLPVQICLTAVLFAAAVTIFLKVYNSMYVPSGSGAPDDKEIFYNFSMQHDLSSREKDVLRLLLDEKTNSEIAAGLFISENTVKYHVRNILQKTGCSNRKELIGLYSSQFH